MKKERDDKAHLSEEIPESSSLDSPVVASPVNNPGGYESLEMLPPGSIRVRREIPENQEWHSKCGFSNENKNQNPKYKATIVVMNYILLTSISGFCPEFRLLIQSGASDRSLGFEDEDLRSPLGWWAATVATYCPSRPGELPKFLSSKPCE